MYSSSDRQADTSAQYIHVMYLQIGVVHKGRTELDDFDCLQLQKQSSEECTQIIFGNLILKLVIIEPVNCSKDSLIHPQGNVVRMLTPLMLCCFGANII